MGGRNTIHHLISKVKLELGYYVNMSSNPTCKETVISTILQMLNVCHSFQKKVIYTTNGWNGSYNVFLHFLKVFSSVPPLPHQPLKKRALSYTVGSMNCYYLSRGQLATNIRDLTIPVPSDPKNSLLGNYPKEIRMCVK